MNDEQADAALIAALELAVAVRDDGAEQVRNAAGRLLDASGGDSVAALAVTAALVRTDLPVDAWWQRGLAGVGRRAPALDGLAPHGTHAAFNRHKAHREHPCAECEQGERKYQSARHRRRYRRAGEAMSA